FDSTQPDFDWRNPEVPAMFEGVLRFWLDRGVDGFRLDTANMYVHDAELRDNPPIEPGMRVNGVAAGNPYAMQQPIYNITRPECLAFHERLRALVDQYPATACVGEIAALLDMHAAMAAYTETGKRLHMAYSFDFLTEEFSAAHVRAVAGTNADRLGSGWPGWAFSNHDVARVVSRWGKEAEAEAAAPLLLALLTSLRGTPCIYQGEELGLPEAVVPFELMQDPYGIRFWPEAKGRDGCRTPMPWSGALRHGGFSTVTPWLPVPDSHLLRAVSVQEVDLSSTLNRARRILSWRRDQAPLVKGGVRFHDAPGEIVAFSREREAERLLCLFNLASAPASFDATGFPGLAALEGHGFAASLSGGRVALGGHDAFFGSYQP
ncbi:MAG TPA: alpha-amylase family glycosyl hydrolase, partial [Paracoccaceae bacterium]|nr:alpha-amylase family glycosyl hydrolase [Paracoccaceae bacterium]